MIVDAHCDTLTKAVQTRQSLYKNTLHWDIYRAAQYGGFVQIMAIFQNPDRTRPSYQGVLHYIKDAQEQESKIPLMKLCRNYKDIELGLLNQKVCCILAIEGGEALEGKIENLDLLFDRGIRCITLTWNYANALGDGALQTYNGGLTTFGEQIVVKMQQKGLLVDISHANEKTFWSCLDISTKPIIASHSNARAVYDHPRNLHDSQLCAIAQTGGVIGVNFYTDFIHSGREIQVSDLLRHIEHICAVAGEDAVGFGADFDGMDRLPVSINGVENLDKILNALARCNYSETVIRKLMSDNFLRVFADVLRH